MAKGKDSDSRHWFEGWDRGAFIDATKRPHFTDYMTVVELEDRELAHLHSLTSLKLLNQRLGCPLQEHMFWAQMVGLGLSSMGNRGMSGLMLVGTPLEFRMGEGPDTKDI